VQCLSVGCYILAAGDVLYRTGGNALFGAQHAQHKVQSF
jgi:hypothetical protein